MAGPLFVWLPAAISRPSPGEVTALRRSAFCRSQLPPCRPVTPDILARNHVNVFGEGSQPMLFAHGFGCDQNMWRFVTPAFESDYRIVLFDYVGAGKSDLAAYDPDRYGRLDGYAQDILDVCHALDLRDVILVG